MVNIINQTIIKENLTLTIDKIHMNMLPPKMKFDQRRYQQVLLNLLSNAVKYSNSGEIKVSPKIIYDKIGDL